MARRETCLVCGNEPEDDELAPLETRIMISNAAGYGAYFDPTEVPAWMHAIAQRPEQHVRLCATCAAEHVHVSAALVDRLASVEEAKERLLPKQGKKLRDRAVKDDDKVIRRRAKALGLVK